MSFSKITQWILMGFAEIVLLQSCDSYTSHFYDNAFKTAQIQINQNKHLLKSGDIIVRTGNDVTSNWLCQLNKRDKTYSHIGIASIENGYIYVYHVVGGESNPDARIRRDLISQFANGYDNKGFGIFRFDFSKSEIDSIVSQAKVNYLKGIPFDMDFDLKTDDKMYCSEFVSKTIQKALGNSVIFALDTISNRPYIAPDAIFLHPHCHEIKRLRYF